MNHRGPFLALCIILVAVLGFAFLRFQNSLRAPFAPNSGAPVVSAAEEESARISAEKAADTDHDGLSDFDELNLYRTSPYLDDTDSDGYPDGDEIRTHHDPNCPTGKTCRSGGDEQASPSAEPLVAPPAQEPETFVGGGSLVTTFDAAEVRKLLRAAGVPDVALDSVDDAALEELYRQVIASSTAQ